MVAPGKWGTEPYLHPGLRQVCTHGQPLTHHHVWVVCLLECLFQSFELLGRECCAAAPLLAVLGTIAGLQDDVLKCTAVGGQGEGAHLIMGNRPCISRPDLLQRHQGCCRSQSWLCILGNHASPLCVTGLSRPLQLTMRCWAFRVKSN